MPKIIKDVNGKLLAAGRDLLLTGGYEKFTMREVAKACGIGLGTAYNYFPSKDVFAARIILKDWQVIEAELEEVIGNASEPREQAEILFTYLRKFTTLYQKVWNQYIGQNHTGSGAFRYHEEFVKKLCSTSGLSWFVVEVILHFVTLRTISYEDIRSEIEKLL